MLPAFLSALEKLVQSVCRCPLEIRRNLLDAMRTLYSFLEVPESVRDEDSHRDFSPEERARFREIFDKVTEIYTRLPS